MNKTLQIVAQVFEFAEKILTQPRNLIKNCWVESWLSDGTDTIRFLEIINAQTPKKVKE